MTKCIHRYAVIEARWDSLLVKCVLCDDEQIRNRCIGILDDGTRCARSVEPEYQTCDRHVREEPPRWGPA